MAFRDSELHYTLLMTIIERSALLPFRVEQIFDLVADIERYPDFLDGCVGAEVHERAAGNVVATLRLSRAGVSHSFTTRNILYRPERMELALVEGPFDHFSGTWRFRALGESACKVSLCLEFQMAGGLVSVAAGRLFDKVAVDLVDAVVTRAGLQLS